MTRNRLLPLALAGALLPGAACAQDSAGGNKMVDGFILVPEAPSKFFVDATATHVPTNAIIHTSDAALADVDGDGDLDVAVAVELGVNRLYLNDGHGRLTYRPGAFGAVPHDNEHVRTADFDRDGNADFVFVSESDEARQLWLGDGRGNFRDASERLPGASQGNALTVGDVNGDGLPDIVIGSTGERGHGADMTLAPARNALLLNDARHPGRFTDASRSHLPTGNDQTEGLVLADMDRDGRPDLVVASPHQPNRLLRNVGGGRFVDASKGLEQTVPTETRDVKVLDANGDGRPDIVFFNITSNNGGWDKDPQARILIADGRGGYRDETAMRLPKHRFSSWAGTVVDFNRDGAPDLLVSAIQVPGFVPMQLRAWQNDGHGRFTDVTQDVVPGITVARSWNMAVGDLDGDGRDDVFITGWGTQARLLLSDQDGYKRGQPTLRELRPRR